MKKHNKNVFSSFSSNSDVKLIINLHNLKRGKQSADIFIENKDFYLINFLKKKRNY